LPFSTARHFASLAAIMPGEKRFAFLYQCHRSRWSFSLAISLHNSQLNHTFSKVSPPLKLTLI